MKNCGKRFHSEVGKFRFLNELIKVVSPKVGGPRGFQGSCPSKTGVLFRCVLRVTHVVIWCQYLGSRSPEPVKKKVLELIYSWTVALPDEAKISDAYQMLKKQGKMARPFRPTPGQRTPPEPAPLLFVRQVSLNTTQSCRPTKCSTFLRPDPKTPFLRMRRSQR